MAVRQLNTSDDRRSFSQRKSNNKARREIGNKEFEIKLDFYNIFVLLEIF